MGDGAPADVIASAPSFKIRYQPFQNYSVIIPHVLRKDFTGCPKAALLISGLHSF